MSIENSNNPTYGQVIEGVMPFFLSRGGEDFASTERILFYLNCAIQDTLLTDNPTFMYHVEIIDTWMSDGKHRRFESTYPIHRVVECDGYYNKDEPSSQFPMTPELHIIRCASSYRFNGKQILTNDEVDKIEICYIRDYEWLTNVENLREEVPLPRRYIPAITKLIMDWASPINLTMSETGTVDFFSHAMNRLDKLAQNDALTDNYRINK